MQLNKQEIESLIDEKIKIAEKEHGSTFRHCLIEILCLEKMLIPQGINEKPERFIPVPKWNEYHPYPSKGALRMLIFNADKNGFNSVIVRNGKRVLINENAFFEWIKAHNKEMQYA